jgi:antitoxin component of RelBE/YafQ-DinJ toxin-antitoxin module
MPDSVPNTVVIVVAVDERVKEDADAALAPLGLPTAEFLRRAVERIGRQDRDWPAALLVEALDRDADVWRGAHEQIEQWFLDRLRSDAEAHGRERFIRQVYEVIRSGRAPDEPLVPSAETIAAMEAVDRGEVKTFATIEELFADLHSDAED